VIARRNDRHRDVDNGTRGTVTALDLATGALTIDTDHGGRRELDATYAAEHLEYAYALTGHGAQGATVEWAGVTGRPGDFSAEWAYTALSRARGHTRLHVSAEPTANQCEREQYAPPEPARTRNETLRATRQAMQRHTAERLAIEQIEPAQLPTFDAATTLPLAEITETGTERASSITAPGTRAADASGSRTAAVGVHTSPVDRPTNGPAPEPDWLQYARRRDALSRGRSLQRQFRGSRHGCRWPDAGNHRVSGHSWAEGRFGTRRRVWVCACGGAGCLREGSLAGMDAGEPGHGRKAARDAGREGDAPPSSRGKLLAV